jgi:hypothetical protein
MSRRYGCTACGYLAGVVGNPLTYLRAGWHALRGCV